jgi:hypothetical protein
MPVQVARYLDRAVEGSYGLGIVGLVALALGTVASRCPSGAGDFTAARDEGETVEAMLVLAREGVELSRRGARSLFRETAVAADAVASVLVSWALAYEWEHLRLLRGGVTDLLSEALHELYRDVQVVPVENEVGEVAHQAFLQLVAAGVCRARYLEEMAREPLLPLGHDGCSRGRGWRFRESARGPS